MARNSDAGRFITLDGLRGIAAIAVAVRHAPEQFGVPFPSSHLAVDMFFALSGFVLAHAYAGKLQDGLSVGRFMHLRLARLYPLYFLSLAVMAIATALALAGGLTDNWTWPQLGLAILCGLFFLPTPYLGPALWVPYPFATAAWSLLFELVANYAYASVARKLTTGLLLCIIGTGAIALVATIAYYGSAATGATWADFGGGLGRVWFSFFLGVLLYRLRHVPTPRLHPIFMAAAMVGIFAAPEHPAFDLLAIVILLPAVVWLGANAEPSSEGLASLFAFLGLTSYGVYILHQGALFLTSEVFRAAGLNADSPVLGTSVLAALIGTVWLLDRYYDQPARKTLARLKAPASRAPAMSR